MAYTVKKGDTLSQIAKSQGVSVSDISGYRSGDPNKIYEGETLNFGTSRPPVAAPPPPDASAYAPPSNAPVSPTTPPATPGASSPGTPPVSNDTRFLRADASYSQDEKNITDGVIKNVGTAPNKEDVLAEKRRAAEASANVVREQYNRILGEEVAAGKGRANRTRALNVSGGLSGSDFASAAAQETDDANLKIIQAREAERDAAVNKLFADAEDRASSEFQSQRDSYLERAEKGITSIKAFREKQNTNVTNAIKAFVGQGYTASKIQKENPNAYAQLLKDAQDAGMSESEFQYQFIANQPAKTKLGEVDIAGGKAYIFQDPLDPSKQIVQEVKIPGYNSENEEIVNDGYGNPVIVTYEGAKGKSRISGTRTIPGIEQKKPEEKEIDSYTDESTGKRVSVFYDPKTQATRSVITGTDKSSTSKETGFSFTNDERGKLINTNLSDSDITNLQKDIREYGKERAVEGLPDDQKKVVTSILSGTKEEDAAFLTRDYLKDLYSIKDEGGFFGGGGGKAQLDSLEKLVKQYRTAGYTDKEILKLVQE